MKVKIAEIIAHWQIHFFMCKNTRWDEKMELENLVTLYLSTAQIDAFKKTFFSYTRIRICWITTRFGPGTFLIFVSCFESEFIFQRPEPDPSLNSLT